MSEGERPQRAWEQVVAWVEERVLDGRLVVGSVLPAERELAAQLGVSRAAVREGVRTLQASGVLVSHVGAGAAGGTVVAGVPHEALTRLLSLHVALANFPPYDVTQVRVALERASIGLTVRDAGKADLDGIRELLERMDEDALTREEFNALDTAFHVALARAGGNKLATDLTVAIRQSMRLPILAGFHDVADWEELRRMLRAEHHAIMAAIEQRDALRAADLVEAHIWSAYERMPALHQARPLTFEEFS